MEHRTKNYGSKLLAKGLIRKSLDHGLFMCGSPKYPHHFPVMPRDFDLRKRVAPPENQMTCGGCWAFSITNSLRSFHMLQGRDPGPLSKNYLLLNQGPISQYGCGGGDFDAGQNMLGGRGPCLEELSPYLGRDFGITYPEKAPVAATAANWVVVGDGCRKPTAQQLCEALWADGQGACLSVDIATDPEFDRYASGIFAKTTSTVVNHMVRLVGYCAGESVDRSGNAAFTPDGDWVKPEGAYFIGRNNWDLDWGIDGDFFIAYAVNNFASTAMVFR